MQAILTNPAQIVDAASLRRYKKQFNFFETPTALADKMAELIDDVGLGAKILEPSAGRGALIRAAQRAIKYQIAPIDFCEVQEDFWPMLTALGARQVGRDFTTSALGAPYDAVIMNPPYKSRAAQNHTDCAWNCIRPGGKIVALVDTSAAEWIDREFEGHIFVREEIAKNTFEETAINTVLFLIHKPMDGSYAHVFTQ